jgi:hypothetical protein
MSSTNQQRGSSKLIAASLRQVSDCESLYSEIALASN